MTIQSDLQHTREEKIQAKRRIPVYMLILIGLFFLGMIFYMLMHWEH